ncbi:MAG: universal stress protein [Actinomycetota bacterium]|nr:universal stress protein [Actinomycetota bacterium]MDH5223705.1 universal stress protein [Actinomycetota bacterium]MDH5313271.1 universal stress protein [Actinomycetota bacterium]
MKVLFATDGAEPSERARELLARLADRARTQVVALSVNGFESAMRSARHAGHFSPEQGHAVAKLAVDEAVEALTAAGFEQVDGRVEDGDEASEIVHAVDHDGFELVVVGSGKERWLDTFVLGSVSSSIVHASPCPILVVHHAPEPGRAVGVVVGADGSEGANHSLAAFIGLADPARCEVTVVAVAVPIALPSGWPAGAATRSVGVNDAEMALARRHATEATDTLAEAGFSVEQEVVAGGAAGVLLDQTEQREADLVVVGARGLGRFRAKVLGSVSDRVIRHAPATLVGR